MVSFAGYDMPLHYSSGIISEHLRCREGVGFFDISHMGQYFITGDLAGKELEKLTPSNVMGLQIGQQRYAILTNKSGGIIDDIIITRTESGFLLIVNAACKEKDFIYLEQHLSDKSEIKILYDYALFALQGPSAASIMAQLSVEASNLSFMQACYTHISDIACLVSRCGYTGEDGFEISTENYYAENLANHLLAFKEVTPAGLGARDTLRLEAGLSLYGQELNESINPVEAGLTWTFRNNARNFPGADIINSQLQSGARKKRIGLIVEGKIPVRRNCALFDYQDNSIGIVTSGNFSPSIGKPIALALIDSGYNETVIYAKVRNRLMTAKISQPPFIPHRYQRS